MEGGGFGWGGVEGWGENADNCNLTTIKKYSEQQQEKIGWKNMCN